MKINDLSHLDILTKKDLNLLVEQIQKYEKDAEFDLEDVSKMPDIKEIVENVFDFIRTGNIFMLAGSRQVTSQTIKKLESNYLYISSFVSGIQQKRMRDIVVIISKYMITGVIFGNLFLNRPSTKIINNLKDYAYLSRKYRNSTDADDDPLTLVMAELYVINPDLMKDVAIRYPIRISESFQTKLGQMAMGAIGAKVYDKFIRSEEDGDIDIGTEAIDNIGKEFSKNFYEFAKRNPRRAAKFIKDVYDVAPDEVREVFWEATKSGAKKTLMNRLRAFLVGLPNIFN